MSERLPREADALAAAQPARAAMMLAAHARVALDVREDPATGDASLTRAHGLSPDVRAVALSRRWSAERRGRNADILALARTELPLVGDPRERIALLFEIAAIEDGANGQLDPTEKALREAAALDASEPGAWEWLGSLHHRRGKHREAVEAWGALATALGDASARSALHTAAGSAREAFLDDATGALAELRRALESDPAHPGALAAIEALHLRARSWVDYARTLVAQGDLVGDPATSRELYERAGDVLWECAGDAPSAAACYERAASMAPRAIEPIEKFAAVLESAGRWADLPRVYERILQVLRDPTQQAAVLVKLGTVYETRLDRLDEAQAAYRRALDATPTFAPAAQALAGVLRAQRNWRDLVALERIEADRLVDPVQRSSRYAAIGEILEKQLDTPEAAVDLYDRALTLDPGNTAAFDALERIHRTNGNWDALIQAHETLITGAKDPARLRALRWQLAQLLLDRTNDPEKAASVLEATLRGPSDEFPARLALARAHASAGRWADHVAALEAQANLLKDEDDLLRTLYRAASVIETRLDDPRRALGAYAKVLEKAPRHEASLRAVSRIHQSQSAWDEVVAVERKLIAIAARPDDAALGLYRIGRIFEERLGRPDDALKAYDEAIGRAPSFIPAKSALERGLRSARRFPQLADLYEKQAALATDANAKCRAHLEAAAAYELHLQDAPRAATHYEQALAAVPDHEGAKWGLIRLREGSGEWQRVDALLQSLLARATHSGARLRILVRLARLNEYRLNNLPRAAQLYEEALATGSAATVVTYDRLRIARTEAAAGTVAQWLHAAATATNDARLALALLRSRALLLEFGGGPAEERLDAWSAALQVHAQDVAGLEGVARALLLGPPDPRFAQALVGRARMSPDAPTRTLLLFVAAAMSETAGRHADAESAYSEALEATPDYRPASAGMGRLRETAGAAPSMSRLAQRAATVATHPQNVADALVDAADITSEKLHDPREALTLYRVFLGNNPTHPRAYQRAVALLEWAGDWGGVATVLGQKAAVLTDDAARARLLASRAAILADRLGDPRGAIADLDRALVVRRDEPALIGMLARLHEREQHWQDAAQTYERLVSVLQDGALKREALLAQARIWTLHVRDYDKARTLLETLHRADPADRPVTEKLAELSLLAGDAPRARDLLVELTTAGGAVDRARALLALSDVQRKGLADHPGSHASASQAFALATQEPAVVPLLDDHYLRSEDWGAFATLGDEAIAATSPKAPGVLPLRMSVARAYRDKLRAIEPADTHLRAAIEAFPDAIEPRIALANGLLGGNDHAAVAEFRRVIEFDPCNAAAYRGLMTVCQRLGLGGAAALMGSAVSLLGEGGAQLEGALALAVAPPPQANALGADDALQLLVGPTRARFVRRVLSLIDPHLHEIFPSGQESLHGLTRVPDSVSATGTVRAVSGSLGAGPVVLLRGGPRDAGPVLSDPRAIVLGPEYFADGANGRVTFEAASACGRIAAASVAGVSLASDQLKMLCETAADPNADGPGYRDLRKRVSSVLPRRVRKEIERLVEEQPGDVRRELPAWEDEERKRALRLGVVFTRDLRVVAQRIAPDALASVSIDERKKLLAAHPIMVDALRFAASEACWAAHRRIFGQP